MTTKRNLVRRARETIAGTPPDDARGLNPASYIEASDAEIEALFAKARARGEIVECVAANTASGCSE